MEKAGDGIGIVQGEGSGKDLVLKMGDYESESPTRQEARVNEPLMSLAKTIERNRESPTRQEEKVNEILMSLEKKMESNIEKIEARNRSRTEWRFPVIYGITNEIREPKGDPCSPTTVSIGPLHRRNERLQIMEAEKLMYMQSLFGRSGEGWLDVQRKCVIAMLEMERDARGCYAEVQPEVMMMDRGVEFAEMMLVDSCFIIELVCRAYLRRSPPQDSLELENEIWDPILDNDFLSLAVKHDLIRLENQIPLCLLQQLYTTALPEDKRGPFPSLLSCLLYFFGDMIRLGDNMMTFKRHSYIEPTHILHLLHDCYWPEMEEEKVLKENKRKEYIRLMEMEGSMQMERLMELDRISMAIAMKSERERERQTRERSKMRRKQNPWTRLMLKLDPWTRLLLKLKGKKNNEPSEDEDDEAGEDEDEEWKTFKYSATQLELAGIKFRKGSRTDLFAVKFSKGRFFIRTAHLEIPPFRITYSTEPFLKNLIAFEQTCPLMERYFTSHAFLMDKLINSAQDVDLLVKAGVLQNYLGSSEEASNLYNNICNHVVIRNFFFRKPCKLVNQHCNRFWPRCMVKLKRDYFGSPWSILAVAAAAILFALTLLQTVFTLLSYYAPRS